jgi:hypothetical protein
MIVMEGAVSRQLSAISHQPSAISQNQMPLRTDSCKPKRKAQAVIGVRLWI